MKYIVNICWFRRDLRMTDHAALYHALQSGRPVLPVFIFDRNILDQLEDKADRRVEFIHAALEEMQGQLAKLGSSLKVYYGNPLEAFRDLLSQYTIEKVFVNRDYEPYARQRDGEVARLLQEVGVSFHHFKDQVIFDRDDVMKDDAKPYTVFTPYSKKWKYLFPGFSQQAFRTEKHFHNFFQQTAEAIPALSALGFKPVNKTFPSKILQAEILGKYSEQRDYPSIEGTSRLGVHLRFGTISIRYLIGKAKEANETFLNELVWREFYQMILWHFPAIGNGASFKPEYDWIRWRNNEEEFERWRTGTTGYPIVDAGMRELNATGYMHNRVRMITASFLTKHLLIDWRWGEAWFAKKLLDYDLAANNGGWQWAAGSGCDAAPYFRIFNPALQTKRFDPQWKYIRTWVPEVDSFDYPRPIVDHVFARERVLEAYKKALQKKN